MRKLIPSLMFFVLSAANADMNLTNDIWAIKFSRSAMDDSKIVQMSVESLENFEYLGKNRATLYIRCSENKTDLFIDYPHLFLSSNPIKLEYRLDKEKSQQITWPVSTDYHAVFANNSIKFVKSMFDKERMLVRLVPHGHTPVSVSFNISGLKDASEPLRQACKW